jgi:RNA polymerase sigma-70 factor (ECF subfamily)
VEAYVFRALKHAVLNYLQSAGLRDKHLEAFERVSAKFDNDSLDILYQKELFRQIKASSDALPVRMKEIFVMNKFENKSVSEISQELNLSEQTVRNQINLALKKIRPSIAGASLLYFFLILYHLS